MKPFNFNVNRTSYCALHTMFFLLTILINFDSAIASSVEIKLSGNAYLLVGGAVTVPSNAILTIEPGSVIKGSNAPISWLEIEVGGRIIAEGTRARPIIFTSSKPEGSQAAGDWGGIIIRGNSIGHYKQRGNTDDSSGVLRYVRVEYAGSAFGDGHLNGISFNHVGSETVVEHLQVFEVLDDAIELLGGNVNLQHVIVSGFRDDGGDWTQGYTGSIQYLICQATAQSSDRGIEGDNNPDAYNLVPRSAPEVYNATIIGTNNEGVMLRNGSAATIKNSIIMNSRGTGMTVHATSASNPNALDAMLFTNNIFFNNHSNLNAAATEIAEHQTTYSINPQLQDIANWHWTPHPESPCLNSTNADSTVSDFIGAIGTDDWTTGWIRQPKVVAVRNAFRHLYINEVMATNRSSVTDEHGEYDDWVEIYNGSNYNVNLDGLYLSDEIDRPTKLPIRGLNIRPHGYQVFWLDDEETQGTRHAGFKLDAIGEAIGLFSSDKNGNTTIDWLEFGPQKADVSFGRYPDGREVLECIVHPTPGSSNISSNRLNLFLNELMAKNRSTTADEARAYDPWIELHNAGCQDINLEGLYLSDSPSHPTRWRFPAVRIPPSGFLVVWVDGDTFDGHLHTNFRINPAGGTILLSDNDANGNAPLDVLRFDKGIADVSLGRYPNGLGTWEVLRTPSPKTANTRAKLYINEVMSRNRSTIVDESGDYDDWIELYNPSDSTVNLGGMFLSDDLNDPQKWQIPAVTIAKGGFLLIWADQDENDGQLHANLNLNSDAEAVGLFELDENGIRTIDAIQFFRMETDVSYGRRPDGGPNFESFMTPTPGESNLSNSETRAGPITLRQNYPNPHVTDTIIPYSLSTAAHLVLTIYNVRGRILQQIDFGIKEPGSYRALWNGRDLQGDLVSSGVYFYTLASTNYRVTRRLIIVR